MFTDVFMIIIAIIFVFIYLAIMIYVAGFMLNHTEVNQETNVVVFVLSQIAMTIVLFHEIYEMIIEVVTKF